MGRAAAGRPGLQRGKRCDIGLPSAREVLCIEKTGHVVLPHESRRPEWVVCSVATGVTVR